MNQPTSGRARRSSRVLVSLPLAVSGQKRDGSQISGAAETILVNRHGARIRSSVSLEDRMEIRLALLAPYKWRVGRVVWADARQEEYGVELGQPENFWGIYDPPEDWELGIPAVKVFTPNERSGAIQSRSAQKKRDDTTYGDTPSIPQGGTIAILRGMAASGVPFQERDLIVPAGANSASMLIGPLVNVGAPMTVIFAKNQLERALVSAVSHNRDYDRWRVWLEFQSRRSTATN
jgi:hypothetical protein